MPDMKGQILYGFTEMSTQKPQTDRHRKHQQQLPGARKKLSFNGTVSMQDDESVQMDGVDGCTVI